ncbi:hypothetical protein ANCCEY_11253 [Ancylostoma ceylanicum]|uniref:Reverse transcriptase domain-containing protein n=1 Tax=Ancylostoma ceylanicum TaxID=53326 RepID=A0A0D6LI80_9BILA|nr:hypothetical protein ANCCEY_11253 [Ancylostoma ceylanicum]
MIKTLDMIRQRGAAAAASNYQLTSEPAKRCREAMKEDLKERREAVLAEAAESVRNIGNTSRDFANRKTKLTALQRPGGTISSSRRVMEKIIYDFYLELFDSQVHLPPLYLRKDGYCEQAEFRKGFSKIDHIHMVTRLIEVSREYKTPLCLTFIDLRKTFGTVETEAILEALGSNCVLGQYIRIIRELYGNFTTRISSFYNDITIRQERGSLRHCAVETIHRHS